MENDILDSLEDIGYTGDLLQEDVLSRAIESGPQSMEYTGLVQFLTTELQQFCSIQEAAVNQITGPDDAANFLMELSGFLREYGCPYSSLSDGPVTQRLATRESKVQLLDFLITELQACRMVASKNPNLLKQSTETTPTPSTADQYESDTARHMKQMLMTLGFPKPPENINAFQMFSKVEGKLKEIMGQYPNQVGKSLLKVRLSDKQWEHIHKINNILSEEYKTRRELLLKRLDVTVQSFMWSDKAKQNENKIAEMYQPIRRALKSVEEVGVPQILAARDDLTRIQRTSSGKHRELTRCAINKVLIPRVPDRGGRAWELEPPPPEMPSFMKRSDAPQGQRPQSARGGGGGRGRGGGGGGGGKVRGGWESNKGDNLGGNWNQGGGGYGNRPQTAGGDYYQGGGGGYQGGGGGGGGYQGGGGYNQGGGGGGYQGGASGGYQGGGGYNQGGGGGYQGGGGRGGGGGGGRGGYRDDYGGGRGGGHRGGGRGRGGRGGRGRN